MSLSFTIFFTIVASAAQTLPNTSRCTSLCESDEPLSMVIVWFSTPFDISEFARSIRLS